MRGTVFLSTLKLRKASFICKSTTSKKIMYVLRDSTSHLVFEKENATREAEVIHESCNHAITVSAFKSWVFPCHDD